MKQITTLYELCTYINLPTEVVQKVMNLYEQDSSVCRNTSFPKLFQESSWTEGLEELRVQLGDDVDGLKMLTCMLLCSLQTYEIYQQLGIDDTIFQDTFRCFTRFIEEHLKSYGSYGFDRAFWTVRQISVKLFRIGMLEYELTAYHYEKIVSIHIPSDAKLSIEEVWKSVAEARKFLQTYFKEYAAVPMACDSWLLAPALQELLPPESNIIRFQQLFKLVEVKEDSREYLQWVYGGAYLCYSNSDSDFDSPSNKSFAALPEDTSLQRRMKKYLLSGGKVGEALGFLKEA